MNYPLISEYVEAIKLAEDNFEELSYLRPVLDDTGQPVMSSGNFAVVFKMKDERDGKLYAVRCFHRDQEGREESYRLIEEELKDVESPYLVSFRYIDKELFVDSSQTGETEFPVLLMDWVEGITLDKYLRENLDDQYALEMLAYRFSQLAQWLIPQPFAHGDLKPDNILVREDGTLVLVDYDGMYVPAMKGQKARELGSPDFRHPLRTDDDFDEHIDDFPFVSILLSLRAISLNPQLLEEYGTSDRLLFAEKDYKNPSDCRFLKDYFPSIDDDLNRIVGLLYIALTEKEISFLPLHLLRLPKQQKPIEELYSTEVSEKDLAKVWEDEYGVKYSVDKKRILKAPKSLKGADYKIKEGTLVVCDCAFQSIGLHSITLPNSVKIIGRLAFANNDDMEFCNIPSSVNYIYENNPWGGCFNIKKMDCLSSLYKLKEGILYSSDYKIVYGIIYWQSHVSLDYRSEIISGNAFWANKEKWNSYIKVITIPHNLISIGNSAFCCCSGLTSINLPISITSIGKSAFEGCCGLTSINIPVNVKSISGSTFKKCCKLTSIVIPDKVTEIGDFAFANCSGLTSINIPDSVISIGKASFMGCVGINSVKFSGNLTRIGESSFWGCTNLASIRIPDSINSLELGVFQGCTNLESVKIPDSVTVINDYVFYGCHNLASIIIPSYSREKFERLLPTYKEILVEQDEVDDLRTNVTNEDWANSWKDEYRVIYSGDKKRLLGVYSNYLPDYEILEGTEVICDDSLNGIWEEIEGLMISGKVTIPSTVRFIGRNPFRGDFLTIDNKSPYFVVEDDVLYTSDKKRLITCFSKKSKIVIPYGVEKIDSFAFYGCEDILQIVIPETVSFIGDNPFIEMNLLCKKTVKLICKSPFFFTQNDSLYRKSPQLLISYFGKSSYLFVKENTTMIGAFAFWANSPKSIYLPSSIEKMAEGALWGSTFSLQHVLIPLGTLKKYNELLPKYSEELQEVDKSFVTIDEHGAIYDDINKTILNGCNIKDYAINDGTIEIFKYAFSDCNALTRIDIPSSVTRIGHEAFRNCKNLKDVFIPNSVTYIGEGAFRHCDKLNNIKISNSILVIDECLFDWCTSLNHVVIPNSVERINNWAFENCKNLISITIPDSVVMFGEDVFFGCDNLVSIIIPIGTTEKFEELLPKYKSKLVER